MPSLWYSSRVASQPFTPAALSPTMWFDPSYGVYSGESVLAGDNDPVSHWVARTGHVATAPSFAARPTYKTNAGNPFLRFDGVDDVLMLMVGNPYLGATAAYSVRRLKTSGVLASYSRFLHSFGTNNSHYVYSDGVIYEAFGTTVRQSFTPSMGVLNVSRTYEMAADGTAQRMWLDGVLQHTQAPNTVDWQADVIGLVGLNASNVWVGDHSHIIGLHRVPTTEEQQAIRTYLSDKL